MLNYIIKRYKDTYTLQNVGLVSFNYIIEKVFCGESLTIENGTVAAGNTLTIDTLTVDGTYIFSLTGTEGIATVKVQVYNNLLRSIIKNVQDSLCGCQCVHCNNDCDSCESDNNLITKLISYSFLTQPQYNAYLQAIAEYINCDIDDTVLCVITKETIFGDADTEHLLKKIVALYYLAFYFADLIGATNQEDKDYIKALYNYQKILPCIKKLGIDVQGLENTLNNMAVFTVTSGLYINQPPSAVGSNTIAVANRSTTTLTLAMFTTQTTPPYADPEGDAVLNLRVNSISGSNVGVFYYDNIAIFVGQIIPATGISAGLLTHISANQNPLSSDSFTFSLSDVGSQQYTT